MTEVMRDQFEPYRPSNGTEGDYFMAEYCDRCAVDAPYREYEALQYSNPKLAEWMRRSGEYPTPCEILTNSMAFGIDDEHYPRDTWVYFNGKPTCLAFRDKDDNGGRGSDGKPIEPDPNQIDMFEELPVLQPA